MRCAVQVARGVALLGTMDFDPTSFTSDELCHIALALIDAAGPPEAATPLASGGSSRQ